MSELSKVFFVLKELQSARNTKYKSVQANKNFYQKFPFLKNRTLLDTKNLRLINLISITYFIFRFDFI